MREASQACGPASLGLALRALSSHRIASSMRDCSRCTMPIRQYQFGTCGIARAQTDRQFLRRNSLLDRAGKKLADGRERQSRPPSCGRARSRSRIREWRPRIGSAHAAPGPWRNARADGAGDAASTCSISRSARSISAWPRVGHLLEHAVGPAQAPERPAHRPIRDRAPVLLEQLDRLGRDSRGSSLCCRAARPRRM